MFSKSQQILGSPNKLAIFRTLFRQGTMSRIELSRHLGLSKMSVTNHVSELMADGIVVEAGTARSDSGRKPILLDIAADRPLFVSIKLADHYLGVGLVNCRGRFHDVTMVPIEPHDSADSILSKIFMLLDQMLTPELLEAVWAIGATSRGLVTVQEGKLFCHIDAAKDAAVPIPIRDILQQRYGIPVYTGNDVSAMAFAEQYFGNATQQDTFAIVGSTVGLGSAMVANGQLFSGAAGLGSLFGHITVDLQGKPCYCGNIGCLEQYASVPAILDWVKKQYAAVNVPCHIHNWSDFLSGAEQGEPICRAGLERLVQYLGAGMVTLVNLFNPTVIYLSELFAQATPLLAEPLEAYIAEHQFFPHSFHTEIRASHFKGSSPVIGPAAFAMHQCLKP